MTILGLKSICVNKLTIKRQTKAMEVLTNYVSKVLIEDTDVPYSILTYIDFDRAFSKEYISNYVQTIVDKNTVLKSLIVKDQGILYVKQQESIDLKSYYTVEHASFNEFDTKISDILNTSITPQTWKLCAFIDKNSNKTRFFFKIHHAYADGYKLIEILTSPFNSAEITKTFSRNISSTLSRLYYSIIGTILMIYAYIQFLFSDPNTNPTPTKEQATDYLICDRFSLNDIRRFTKAKNITVNDFLYAVVVRSQYYYTNKEKTLFSISPINLTNTNEMNNMAPLLFNTKNSLSNDELLSATNSMFNCAKYSLFVPLLSILIQTFSRYVPVGVLSYLYNLCTSHSDFIYSNIIGPTKTTSLSNVRDIHFLTTAKSSELIFNIISFEDNINLICSFKKGLISNKPLLKDCILRAYTDLLLTDVHKLIKLSNGESARTRHEAELDIAQICNDVANHKEPVVLHVDFEIVAKVGALREENKVGE